MGGRTVDLGRGFFELRDERERRKGYKLQQVKLWLYIRKRLFIARAVKH